MTYYFLALEGRRRRILFFLLSITFPEFQPLPNFSHLEKKEKKTHGERGYTQRERRGVEKAATPRETNSLITTTICQVSERQRPSRLLCSLKENKTKGRIEENMQSNNTEEKKNIKRRTNKKMMTTTERSGASERSPAICANHRWFADPSTGALNIATNAIARGDLRERERGQRTATCKQIR